METSKLVEKVADVLKEITPELEIIPSLPRVDEQTEYQVWLEGKIVGENIKNLEEFERLIPNLQIFTNDKENSCQICIGKEHYKTIVWKEGKMGEYEIEHIIPENG